jgi:hypothetical protein
LGTSSDVPAASLPVGVDGSVALLPVDVVVPVVVVTVVLAPPVACTIPSRGSTVSAASGVESSDELGGVAAPVAPVDDESVPAAVEFAGEVDEELESDDGSDDELDSEGSSGADGDAQATPGILATAAPIPSATASAPTRPM